MSVTNGFPRDDAREIARGLATAVHAAVATVARPGDPGNPLVWNAAAGVAELLNLPGLAALLTACARHADAPPVGVRHVIERLARLAHDTDARAELAPFAEADRELAALAGTLAEQQWSAPTAGAPTPEAVVALGELLGDFELHDPESLGQAGVTLPVAAGLRAALDWIGADDGGALRATLNDATLTLTVRASHEPGLGPAGAVLALTGGTLLPEPDGRWAVRVPLDTDKPAWLLARQGELALALPWHAVARLRIADDAARATMTEPSLAPWSPLERTHGERPAALLAVGLSRAWLHLDHIVWRMFAHAVTGHGPAAIPGAHARVRTDDGVEYWVVDSREALHGVPELHTLPVMPRPRAKAASAAAPPVPVLVATVELVPPESAPAASASAPEIGGKPEPVFSAEPSAPHAVAAPVPPRVAADESPVDAPRVPRLTVLGPADVRPVGARPRHALLVDDSLVARMALARELERAGWRVEFAESAAEMWHALETESWDAVFVDVSLPDAVGRAHLAMLVARQIRAEARFDLVGLTRDASEERLVAETGITRTLRKPFAAAAVQATVRSLASPPADA